MNIWHNVPVCLSMWRITLITLGCNAYCVCNSLHITHLQSWTAALVAPWACSWSEKVWGLLLSFHCEGMIWNVNTVLSSSIKLCTWYIDMRPGEVINVIHHFQSNVTHSVVGCHFKRDRDKLSSLLLISPTMKCSWNTVIFGNTRFLTNSQILTE